MKRWLLWNLHCLRGRRCADCVIVNPDDLQAQLDEHFVAEQRANIGIDYTCGGCGTNYRWDLLSRQRVRI
jgi:hypothetical protein